MVIFYPNSRTNFLLSLQLKSTVNVFDKFLGPHPASPKYDEKKPVCGFEVYIVGFGGGARA
jgi:hypothetical protein